MTESADIDSTDWDLYGDVIDSIKVLSALFHEKSDEANVLAGVALVFEMGRVSELYQALKPIIDPWILELFEYERLVTENMVEGARRDLEMMRVFGEVLELVLMVKFKDALVDIKNSTSEDDDLGRARRVTEVFDNYLHRRAD